MQDKVGYHKTLKLLNDLRQPRESHYFKKDYQLLNSDLEFRV